jgi:hypothetical protein
MTDHAKDMMFLRILFLVMIKTWIAGAIASPVTGRGVIARSVAALRASIVALRVCR